MKLAWHFAPTGGGEEFGIHEAGVETFKPVKRAVVREFGQNSGDAKIDPDDTTQPVLIVFRREAIPLAKLPGLAELEGRFEQCKAFQQDDDATEFFDNALTLIRQPKIECLRVQDFFTTGVEGSDTDRASGWKKLVRSSGSSTKGAQTATGALGSDGGGSFGIGKKAAIAASQFRTVYYSTLTLGGDRSFAGVTLLTTHEDAHGVSRQPKAYYGGPSGCSVTDPAFIPKLFERDKAGLDVLITAFDFGVDDGSWETDIILEVLSNFWPAICWGKIVFQVGSTTIDRACLPIFLQQFADRDGFYAHLYHKAYCEATALDATTKRLKTCSAKVLAGENYPKKIAMFRKNGMVIEERSFRSAMPFAGVFECTNQDGNSVLRTMEPPRHDRWDPHRPKENANVVTEKEFKRVIYDAIQTLTEGDSTDVGDVSGLGNLLPCDDDSLTMSPANGLGGETNRRSIQRLPASPKPTIRKPERPRPQLRKKKRRGGPPTPVTHLNVSARAVTAGKPGAYELHVRPDPAHPKAKAFIEVNIAGDDQTLPTKLIAVNSTSGRKVPIDKDDQNAFGPVVLGKATVYLVSLSTTRRVALEVSAYEA